MIRTAISEEDLRPTMEQEPDPAAVEHWTDDAGRTAEIVRESRYGGCEVLAVIATCDIETGEHDEKEEE